MKILIYGGNGYIGDLFINLLNQKKIAYKKSNIRVNNTNIDDIKKELLEYKPTHVFCSCGTVSGIYNGKLYNNIDYLEHEETLDININNNLFSPVILSILCSNNNIHYTYIGTGCIYNDTSLMNNFKESDILNFKDSKYSLIKGYTDQIINLLPNSLNLRLRLPIDNIHSPKNLITKLLKYDKICSISNSVTVIPELFPYIIDLMKQKYIGTLNFTNPGNISHNEILELYKKYTDNTITWNNYTEDEQNKQLLSKRCNNTLDTTLLQELFPDIKNVKDSIIECLKTIKNFNKLKVVCNCVYFTFHRDYILNIKEELEKRGHECIITESRDKSHISGLDIENKYIKDHSDADFTIQPDEACRRIGGKGIYINHCIPVVPQNSFYFQQDYKEQIEQNCDWLFLTSNDVCKMYNEFHVDIPSKIIGFPKLDNVYNYRKEHIFNTGNPKILYAPTGSWKKNIYSGHIFESNRIENVHILEHPNDNKSNISCLDYLQYSDIVISDYSSIYLESIILNIPTIVIDNDYWNESESLSESCRNACIRVKSMDEILKAIEIYKNNPSYLEDERLYYKNKLVHNLGDSSKLFVDELEKISI